MFAALYRDLVPRLAAYLIVGFGASKREAAECAHEALEQYFHRRDVITHPRAWCRCAARSIFLRRCYDALESFAEVPATGTPLYVPAAKDPAEGNDELRDTLLPLVAQLPARQREVVALVLQGLDYAEIAAELDQPVATIRSHLRHAKARMAELLNHDRRQDQTRQEDQS